MMLRRSKNHLGYHLRLEIFKISFQFPFDSLARASPLQQHCVLNMDRFNPQGTYCVIEDKFQMTFAVYNVILI